MDIDDALIEWYGKNKRSLPWREPGVTAWGVLVSEIMLQQTPVARVEPIWSEWMERWPVPSGLAAVSQGEV
ncbi:A/G-specific adenine glycosylase, partial [Kibdelosporangium lantanae]